MVYFVAIAAELHDGCLKDHPIDFASAVIVVKQDHAKKLRKRKTHISTSTGASRSIHRRRRPCARERMYSQLVRASQERSQRTA